MPNGLSAAALAFAKVFGAHQQGAMAGKQRAREDVNAAQAETAALERAKLDEFVKRRTVAHADAETAKIERESTPEWIAEAQRRQEELIRVRAKAEAELRAPPVAPVARGPVPGTPEHYDMLRKQQQIANQGKPTGAASPQAMRQAMQLTGAYNNDPTFKDAGQIAGALGAMRAASTTGTGAGDISLVYSFMKLMDPGSVVREGEFATAQNSGSIPESVRNAYNRALSGQRLTPGQRTAFVAQGETKAQAQRRQLKAVMQRYSQMAQRYGVDPADVVFDPYETVLDAPGVAPGAAPAKPGVAPKAPTPWDQ